MTAPTDLQLLFHQAIQHHQSGNLTEAESLYRQILTRVPNHPDAIHFLGVLAGQAGRSDVAIDLIQRAISINPSTADYHCNLGEILRRVGRIDQAIACQRRAIELRPNYVTAWSNLGVSLRDSAKSADAIEAFRKAIELGGNFPELFANLGNALKDKQQLDGAIAAYQRAIDLNPNYAQAHNNLAVALRDKKQLSEAAISVRRAIDIDSGYTEARYNLGGILMEQGEFDAAREAFLAAISLNPNHASSYNNLGSCWMRQARPQDALPLFERAIQLDPTLADARFNRGLAFLMMGNFSRGFPDYEWRAHVKPQFIYMRQGPSRPQWDGSSLDGRTIFLHAEQGFGDTIQFIRFVPQVAQRDGKIILAVQPQLERLLRQIPGIHQMVSSIDATLKYDFQCPLLSLPLALGTELDSIPPAPYLKPNDQIAQHWRERFATIPGKKVGLAWAGNTANEHDAIRSISLDKFSPLASIEGVTLFSLQKDKPVDKLPDVRMIDWTQELNDFADTAGLIQNLDLIITVDSAVAHLAGALGKPVWILIPHSPDWRWMTDREDSPWYSTAKLFRQNRRGDWQSVISAITAELSRNQPPRNNRERQQPDEHQ